MREKRTAKYRRPQYVKNPQGGGFILLGETEAGKVVGVLSLWLRLWRYHFREKPIQAVLSWLVTFAGIAVAVHGLHANNLGLFLAGLGMAYSAPSTRSTGDLITAAIWNQDVVDNVIAVNTLATKGVLVIPYQGDNIVTIGSGYTRGARVAGSFLTYGMGRMPSDFASLDYAGLAIVSTSTETITGVAVNTEYGAEDNSESYANHTGSTSGVSIALTANQVKLYEMTTLFSSLAALDRLNFLLTSAFSPAGTPIALYFLILYTKE